MPVVAHPGPSAPRAPGVSLEVPDGWAARPPGDALLRAGGPGSLGDDVEIVVRHVAAPPERDSAAVVDIACSAAGAGGGQVEEPFVVEIGGREWDARNVSWDEGGSPVVEVHLATALPPPGPVSRHVHAVGTVRGAGLDADYDAVQAVLETLTVAEAQS